MFKKIDVSKIILELKKSFIRFPIGILSIIIVSGLFFYMINIWNLSYVSETIIFKLIITFILTFFLSIWLWIYWENIAKNSKLYYILQLNSIFFAVLFYYFFNLDWLNIFCSEEVVYIFMLFVWVLSFLFLSAFIQYKYYTNIKYYSFFIRMFNVLIKTIFIWWTISLLGVIAIGSIITLFGLSELFDIWKIFENFLVFALSIFAPLFLLNSIEKWKDIYKNLELINFFKFFIKNILITAAIWYFVILYIYTIKVLLNFSEWPHGEVVWMVIWFSLFAYIVYIISFRLEYKNNFIKNFRKYLPFVVVPQLLMLFYAIWLRIMQYDVTINRYLVVVLGIILLIISIYLIISKEKRLIIIPFVLFLFTFITSIWPWGIYSLPEYRQVNILKINLTNAGILKNNQIIIPKNESDIDQELSWKIHDAIWYLINNHSMESIEYIFPNIIKQVIQEDKDNWLKRKYNDVDNYKWIQDWELIEWLRKKLKVKYYSKNLKIDRFIDYRLKDYDLFYPLQIKGYTSMYNIIQKENDWQINKIEPNMKSFLFDNKKNILEYREWEKIIETIELKPFFNKLEKINREELSKEQMTFEIQTKEYDVKILFKNINIEKTNKNIKIDKNRKNIILHSYIDWYVLVRKKI